MEIKQRIRQFLSDNILFGDSSHVNDDTSFLGEGIVDSTGVVELVLFVEETFGIQVDDDEIVPDNFDTIDNLAAYIEQKRVPARR